MLPNFRRSEPDLKPMSAANSGSAPTLSPRPFLAVARTEERRASTMIGADLTISGNLVATGEVSVDGTVEGDIRASHVVVGEPAVVTGGIVAEEVVVRGHVSGSIHAKRVMLTSTCVVEGDIFHQSLSIEQGAMFEGKSRRSGEDPRKLAERTPEAEVIFVRPPALPELN